MNILSFASEGSYAERLRNSMLLPSLVKHEPNVTGLHLIGQRTLQWDQCCRIKAELMAAHTKPFLYVDTDVVFLQPFQKSLKRANGQPIFFGDDGIGGVCMGVVYAPMPQHPFVRQFFEAVLGDQQAWDTKCNCDQEAANRFFDLKGLDKRDFLLPREEWWSCGCHRELRGAAKLGWRPRRGTWPSQAVCVHATCVWREDKEAVLKEYTNASAIRQ